MDLFRIDADEVAQRIGLDEPVPITWIPYSPYGTATFDILRHRIVLDNRASWYDDGHKARGAR